MADIMLTFFNWPILGSVNTYSSVPSFGAGASKACQARFELHF